jgi:hypothetical protein
MSDNLNVKDDEMLDVELGNPKPMGFCSICNTSPCNADNHYWGVCPTCHRTDGYINAGRTHIFFCREHRTRWIIGANLFSSWRDETEDEQRALYDQLEMGKFEEVEPHCCPIWSEAACGTVVSAYKFSLPNEAQEKAAEAADAAEKNTND